MWNKTYRISKGRDDVMVKLNEIQWCILEKLCQEPIDTQLNTEDSVFRLKETDSMLRIREMVFHIDHLIEEGYLMAEEAFYEASDKMSFEYMNSAITIDLAKVNVTALGRSLVADRSARAQFTLIRRSALFLKNLFAFSASQWVLILLIGAGCFFLGYSLK